MQRMVLAHDIGQKIDEILYGSNDQMKSGAGTGMTSRSMKASGKSMTTMGMVSARSSGSKDRSSSSDSVLLQSMVARHIDTKTLVSATYVCDFGNVISGIPTTLNQHHLHPSHHQRHLVLTISTKPFTDTSTVTF